MPRRPDPTLKPAIVDKVTAHLRDTPLDAVSVRSLGRVLGTSAYPIVYHFGSRAALVESVIDSLDGRIAAHTLAPDASAEAMADHLVAVYGELDDPDHVLAARLAFELGAVESLAPVGGGPEPEPSPRRPTTAAPTGRRHRDLHRAQVDVLTAWCVMHGAPEHAAASAASDAVLAARGVQWGYLLQPGPDAAASAEAALRRIAARVAASMRLDEQASIPAEERVGLAS